MTEKSGTDRKNNRILAKRRHNFPLVKMKSEAVGFSKGSIIFIIQLYKVGVKKNNYFVKLIG